MASDDYYTYSIILIMIIIMLIISSCTCIEAFVLGKYQLIAAVLALV